MSIRSRQLFAVAVLLGLVLAAGMALYGCDQPLPTNPSANRGQPWRIGYYEGGSYADYAGGLCGLGHGLAELGWIEPTDLPVQKSETDSYSLWQHLATEVDSRYIQFVPDGYWSADWRIEQRAINRSQAIDRLQRQELDLIIAMGTWAGEDLATDEHQVPVLVFRSNDPVRAGIIDSAQDSGLDHVMAETDPDRFLRQARLFHDIFDFRRLGVAYDKSAAGQVYSNVPELRKIAEERAFELVECQLSPVAEDEEDMAVATEVCYRQLAPAVDAVWIGAGIGEQPKFMPDILEPLMGARLPTWSSMGTEAVRRGTLMSVSLPADYTVLGHWYATCIAQVLDGANPRDLEQVFEAPMDIAINLETARRIGFDPPKGLLQAADTVFDDIERE